MTNPPKPGRRPFWCDPHPPAAHPLPRDGRRHCGALETVLRRQWDPSQQAPPPDLIAVIDRLAGLPVHIASRVTEWVEGIWVGDGNVPDLDHLGYLAGQPIRQGAAATWDEVPGATVGRTVVIGTGRTVSASLVDHELGHVVERMDQMADRPEWGTIMFRCRPLLIVDRWNDPLEWWAEGWALTCTGQFGRLVRNLSGHEQVAETVAAYYRRHYGIWG